MASLAVRVPLLCLLFGTANFSQSPARTFVNLPLTFEPNLGQAPQGVRFLTRSGNSTVLFFDKEVVVTQGKRALRLKTGSNAKPKLEGLDAEVGRSNYMLGRDRTRWHTNVPQYDRLRYGSVYPGIDLVFHGEAGKLEYDFVVGPGADPGAIRVALQGAGALSIAANGDLEASGAVVQPKPVAYQVLGGDIRNAIDCRYRKAGRQSVAFHIGDYDRSLPLVIDPVLVYSTFLAAPNDSIYSAPSMAVDQAGFVYVAGTTQSAQFPVTANTFDSQYHGNVDMFVAKLDPTGSKLIYSTYLGGSDNDAAFGLAINAAGNAYIVGTTSSPDFPVTPGSFQTKYAGKGADAYGDAFVIKLDPSGSHLVYATYLGGSNSDAAAKVAVDALGNAYITGGTASSDFPITPRALQAKYVGGPLDVFLTKLNPTGSTLLFSTYLGGSGYDSAADIALDGAGNIYIAGRTFSADFPVTAGAYQTVYHRDDPLLGGGEAYVVKIDALGSHLVYGTFLGGTAADGASAIAVDQGGSAYVTGSTNSYDFPATPGSFQPTHPSQGRGSSNPSNGFVTKLNPAGTGLSYSTYLGGSGLSNAPPAGDGGLSIAIDQAGDAYIGGYTASPNFPTVNPIQAVCGIYCGLFASSTGFIAHLDPAGSSLLFSTFLGGFAFDTLGRTGTYVSSIALSGPGFYVAGGNGAKDFPTTPGAFQTSFQHQAFSSCLQV